MKKWILAAAAAVSMTAAATAAGASTYFTPASNTLDGSVQATFGDDGVGVVPGTFTEIFNFSTVGIGDLTSSLTKSTSHLTLNWATLDGSSYSLSPGGGVFQNGNIDLGIVGSGAHQIKVNFTTDLAGSTYSGTVAFSPQGVPEPAAWGLMIAGFGLMGATMRLRRKAGVLAA